MYEILLYDYINIFNKYVRAGYTNSPALFWSAFP